MRNFVLTLLGIIAVLVFSLYATIGETGPIGWINAAQARSDGSYSRAISAFVLLIGVCLVVMGVIYVIEFFQKIWRAVLGPVAARSASIAAPPATPAPTDFAAVVAQPKAPMPAPSGWRMALTVWAVFHLLVWGSLFAWYGWDWHLRRADVVSPYVPMLLSRGVEPAHPEGGSHLALQGAIPLWDHAVTRRSSKSSNVANAIYVPVATADWRSGDPVYFIAQFDDIQQLYDLQRAAGAAGGPVLVRVDGAVAGAARPVFERSGVPVGDNAVAVTAVMSRAGRPTQADPPFAWMSVLNIGIIITGLFTLLPLAGVLGLKREEWMARRRQARAAPGAAFGSGDRGGLAPRPREKMPPPTHRPWSDGMAEIILSGHTRVGFISREGGKAGITVSKEKLLIRCGGTYEFRPDQVVAFAPDGPAWMSRGFRITHNRADTPGRVYFSCSGGRDAIVAALTQVGFVPCGEPFTGMRRPGAMRLVFIAMAIASAVLLLRGHPR